jgi:hypothetical protein
VSLRSLRARGDSGGPRAAASLAGMSLAGRVLDVNRGHQLGARPHERSDPSAEDVPEVHDLAELLDRIDDAATDGGRTSVDDILDRVGKRSFAPVLLVAGIVMLAPVVGDIPGVPVLMGLIVILVASQFLLRRDHIWLPQWILRRSVDHKKVEKAVKWLRKPARFVDRWTKPRLSWAVRHAGAYVIGIACILVSAATPIMEFVPFSANFAGIAITAFGLALIAEDGAIALVAIAVCVGAIGLLGYQLLG